MLSRHVGMRETNSGGISADRVAREARSVGVPPRLPRREAAPAGVAACFYIESQTNSRVAISIARVVLSIVRVALIMTHL
jgi:hypothetical protein